MAGAFPPQPQAGDGQAHALPGDRDAVLLPEVLRQQWGGPDRRTITDVPRVSVEDHLDQRIDDTLSRPRATTPCALGQAGREVKGAGLLEAVDPVVDGPASDPQAFGHIGHTFASIEPQ
jgi:hypothetical protein